MSQHVDSLRCPECARPIRFERDYLGGVRQWCPCGHTAPLKTRAAPPLPTGPERRRLTFSGSFKSGTKEYAAAKNRHYYEANREKIIERSKASYARRRSA